MNKKVQNQVEIEKENGDRRRGCATLVVLALVLGSIYTIRRAGQESSLNANNTQQAIAQAATGTQSRLDRATQLVLEPTTQTARETDMALTPSATPTEIPTLTLTASLTNTRSPSPTPVYAAVNGGGINARSCPTTSCEIVSVVSSDEQITVLGSIGDWYWVELADGQTGYICGDLLRLPEGAVVGAAPTLTATDTPISTRTPLPVIRGQNCQPNVRSVDGFRLTGSGQVMGYAYEWLRDPRYTSSINFADEWGDYVFSVTLSDIEGKGVIDVEGISVDYGFEGVLGWFQTIDFSFEHGDLKYAGEVTLEDELTSSRDWDDLIEVMTIFIANLIVCE